MVKVLIDKASVSSPKDKEAKKKRASEEREYLDRLNEEQKKFHEALKKALGDNLSTPILEQTTLLESLAKTYKPQDDFDKLEDNKPVSFTSPKSGNGLEVKEREVGFVPKDDETDFTFDDAMEMVKAASLNEEMLKKGITVIDAKTEEIALIQEAVKIVRKSLPKEYQKTFKVHNAIGTGLGRDRGKRKNAVAAAKTAVDAYTEEKDFKYEEPEKVGVLLKGTYTDLTEHIKSEGKATNKIITDFLRARDLGDGVTLAKATADAKTKLESETFITVKSNVKGHKTLSVTPTKDFGDAADGGSGSDKGTKPDPEKKKPGGGGPDAKPK